MTLSSSHDEVERVRMYNQDSVYVTYVHYVHVVCRPFTKTIVISDYVREIHDFSGKVHICISTTFINFSSISLIHHYGVRKRK